MHCRTQQIYRLLLFYTGPDIDRERYLPDAIERALVTSAVIRVPV